MYGDVADILSPEAIYFLCGVTTAIPQLSAPLPLSSPSGLRVVIFNGFPFKSLGGTDRLNGVD